MSDKEFPNVKASSVAIVDKENGYTNYRVGFNTAEAEQLLAQLKEALENPQSTGAMFQFSYGKTGQQRFMNGDGYFRPKFARREDGPALAPRSTAPAVAATGAKSYAPKRFQG